MDADRPFSAGRIDLPSPEWDTAAAITKRAMRLTSRLNRLSPDDADAEQVRAIFRELTGRDVDETFRLFPPFYSAYGRDLRVGHKVFINQCCTIYDMGGVSIGDRVMIGPNVSLITTGHPVDPAFRRAYVEAKPITIEANVWLAAGVTVIGGVTIGENAAVGAGSVVTKSIPANSFAAGVPARVVRSYEPGETSP